ncbi:MAG TPA: hypothetical protein VLA00_08715 [Xanthobacteraceae bacterium]|nr:hypothetical protein [Xanthobacteraceae bacterium]
MTCCLHHIATTGAALLLALSLHVRADEADYDPWNGLAAIVAPPAEVEDGGPLPDASAEPEDPAPVAPAPDEVTADASEEAPDEPVSAWIIIELGIGDADDGALAAPPDRRPQPAATVVAPQPSPLPTKLDIDGGPARLEVSGSVATTDPVSDADRKVGGGGSGELRSRLGYSLDAFTLYGVGGMGAAESAGAVSVYRSLVLGGAYAAPLGGPQDGRIGAKVEIADTAAVTAGVEYRAGRDGAEGFVSLEQVGAPNAAPAGMVRAGVVGKF